MSASFPTLPTHVAILHRKPVGYHFCVGTRAGGSNSRSLIGSTSQSITEILPATRSVARSSRDGRLRATIERTQSSIALVARIFARGLRAIRDFCRRLKVPGNLSLLRSLVQHCQESSSGIFQAFFFPPVLSLRAAHVVNSNNGAGGCPTKEFPKTEKRFPRIA